ASLSWEGGLSATSPSLAAVRVRILPSPEVREGGSATLTCAVAGGAEEVLSYSWYRNGRWLRSGPSPALALPRVSASDAGSYHCSVRTPARNRSAAPAPLSVLCECPGPGAPSGGGAARAGT
ncbi:SN protein, partial [Onychorhynchus coronatus]|nr:SN protein [Onychorhynchus coronatus]